MDTKLRTIDEVEKLILKNRTLVIAGNENLLSKLPAGNWIGGTNPYLLGEDGAKYSTDKLYVKDFTDICISSKKRYYSISEIEEITTDGFENGIIFVIVPGFSEIHYKFSIKAPNLDNQFINPLIGWVSGSKFEEIKSGVPSCYVSNEISKEKIAVMHLELPKNKVGRVEIINLYEQDEGQEITFPEDGFQNTHFFVDGKKENIFDYFEKNKIDWHLPLVANYSGAKVNVGMIKDDTNKKPLFAAPVFKNVKYKIAKNINIDYINEFLNIFNKERDSRIEYSYSCLYNYFNFNLEGKKIPGVTGTFTFGEFAYQLLNVTFVYLIIEEI